MVELLPKDFSLVLVGRWNRSILTPAGIADRLFRVTEEVPLQIDVALDVLLPHRVTHDGLQVTVGADRLTITTIECDFESLAAARVLAINALESLPETPVSAVGLNCRYSYDQPDDYLASIQQSLRCPIDDSIEEDDATVKMSDVTRKLDLSHCDLNLSVIDQNDSITVVFNFEKNASDQSEIRAWLEHPIDFFVEQVGGVASKYLHLPEEMDPDAE